eukprot:4483705-Pyramimonas_sp.AAC.1
MRWVNKGLLAVWSPTEGAAAAAATAQNWRCVVEINEGRQVSANMAPASKTESVMHVKAVARAMNGMETFEPLK